jgi:hypothetical protein
VNWTLSWPSALEICGKRFFNKGLISSLILLGKAWALNFSTAFVKIVFLLLAPGSALEKFAAIVIPENKPAKVNWALSWPTAVENCGKCGKAVL